VDGLGPLGSLFLLIGHTCSGGNCCASER